MHPAEGSERQIKFQKYRQFIVDLVRDAIQQRKDGEEGEDEHVPFIDNLLQSAVPEEQVCACVHVCVCIYCVCMRYPLLQLAFFFAFILFFQVSFFVKIIL